MLLTILFTDAFFGCTNQLPWYLLFARNSVSHGDGRVTVGNRALSAGLRVNTVCQMLSYYQLRLQWQITTHSHSAADLTLETMDVATATARCLKSSLNVSLQGK